MDPTDTSAILNLAAALDRVGGDKELLEEVAQLFLDTSPHLLAGIRQAVAARDAPALERSAHTLKGSVGNFGAEAAFQAALRLERIGRSRDLSGAEEALQALEGEMERLRPVLARLGQGGGL
jgi:HPt (histidine-containing phosphotransfer) domain-containing protein